MVIPAIIGMALAFFDWNLIGTPVWAGLDNFARLFSDTRVANSVWVTLLFCVGVVAPTLFIGFVLAALLNVPLRGLRIVRTMYYFPIIISLVASGVLWRRAFQDRGVVNFVLSLVGIDGPNWLIDVGWAPVAVIIVLIWKSLPLAIVLYLAALQDVPPELHEAAKVDGAGVFSRLRHITWPLVAPTSIVVTMVTLISVIFGSFDVIVVMTGGGPLNATDALSVFIYEVAFRDLDVGYASSLASTTFVIFFVATIFVFARQKRATR